MLLLKIYLIGVLISFVIDCVWFFPKDIVNKPKVMIPATIVVSFLWPFVIVNYLIYKVKDKK